MDKKIARANSLLRRAQRGDERALDALLIEYGTLLKSFAVRYLYDSSYADDLINDVLLELFKTKLKSFDPKFNGLNWLYTIIKRRAYKYNGKYIVRAQCEKYYDDENLTSILDSLECQVGINVERAALSEALKTLSDYENKLLYYTYWECLTVREIADVVKKPRSSVNKTINDSLLKLRKLLK